LVKVGQLFWWWATEVVAEEVNVKLSMQFCILRPEYNKYRGREAGGRFIFYQKFVCRPGLVAVYVVVIFWPITSYRFKIYD
jgi:hypothetical protein